MASRDRFLRRPLGTLLLPAVFVGCLAEVDPKSTRSAAPIDANEPQGDTGANADAGTVSLPSCDVDPLPSPFVPSAPPTGDTFEARRAYIEATRAGMTGRWRGWVSTPWTAAYPVSAEFRDDGSYSARSLQTTEPRFPAFYYGIDDDHPLKRFRLLDVTAYGLVRGEIDLVFFTSGTPNDLPSWQGLLEELTLDALGNRLQFDFRTSSGYGDVHFDLWRCR